MNLKVYWSEDALANAQSIFTFIAQDNVQNAHLVAKRIDHTVGLLAEAPFGKLGRIKNTYEAIVPKTPFIVVYQLAEGKSVTILRLIHGARNWPEGEWPK